MDGTAQRTMKVPGARAAVGAMVMLAAMRGPVAAVADGGLAQRLVLVGVVLGNRGGPVAAIADGTSRSTLYHVGDSVRGAVLTAVGTDRAVLSVDGQEVELRLAVSPRRAGWTAPPPSPSPPVPRPPRWPFRRP